MKISLLGAIALAVTAVSPVSAGRYMQAGDTSAWVADWAYGSLFENFAFVASTSTFVGSWMVGSGPAWQSTPIAYSGLMAAAALFGGAPSDYFLSTVDDNAANADRLAWVSTYGGVCSGINPCGSKVDEGFVTADVSAIPEPASWILMVAGFGLIGAGTRRRRRAAARASLVA